jgi:hypothetical protein
MDKLTFKYEVMHLFDDRYEFRRFKKKPFGRILRDIFINRTGIALLILSLIWIVIIICLPNVPALIGAFVGSLIFQIFSAFTEYYGQYKDAAMLISHIQNTSISKDKKTLQIKYNKGKYTRIKTVDMPDADAERQYIIDKLNEINIFK